MRYLLTLVIGLVVFSLPARPGAAPPGQSAAASPVGRIEAIRDEARALVRIQSVLSWYTRTRGEPSILAETYKGHDALFSLASYREVTAAMEGAIDAGERRALQFLRSYIAGEYLGQKLSRYDDERENAELRATVVLPWVKQPVPYKQLDILSSDEKGPGRRAAIESARARIWKEQLNPILERKEAEGQRLARELGYDNLLALAQEYRLVDLKTLIAQGERFRQATDALYRGLLEEQARLQLGLRVAEVRRSDIGRLRKAPAYEKFFPKELAVPALEHFLAGVGLDLSTAAGTIIVIDDAPAPKKEPRAACYPMVVPDDIRISVKPSGGLADFVTLFHEAGHALHYANTRTPRWELQQLGPYALTEALAETMGHVWDDPRWLRRYRDFVVAWNRQQRTSVPVMSDADIRGLVRLRVFDELYFLRRYGSAKLIYEAALHGGTPALWQAVYPGDTGDLQALYRALFGRAYGFALGEEDALRFRTDVDDLLYSADYTRAFALANLIHEGLAARFGQDWFVRPAVGKFLREQLFADGNRLQADEVARLFGAAALDFTSTERRLQRLLAEK